MVEYVRRNGVRTNALVKYIHRNGGVECQREYLVKNVSSIEMESEKIFGLSYDYDDGGDEDNNDK